LGSLGRSLGGPLARSGKGPLGSFGGSQGRVACRDEILEISGGSQQATHRQPVSLDAYISEGISMFAGPPSIAWYWVMGLCAGGLGPP